MTNKNILFIETPFQLLNAIEAIHEFPAEKHTIFIRLNGAVRNDSQIIETLEKITIPKNVIVNTALIRVDNKALSDLIKISFYKMKFLFINLFYSKVFIGNLHSGFFKLVIPVSKTTTLLDDGFKSVTIQNEFSSTNFINWFTIFDFVPIGKQSVVKNKFKYLHSVTTDLKPHAPTILFIGSKLSEENIIEEAYNVELVQNISKLYSDESITYVSHRDESQKKLDKIRAISNIKVVSLSYPLELLPIYGEFTPSKIISFFSTALITLNKIYQVETIAYKFDYPNYKNKANIDLVYAYCKKYISVKNI